jgi:mono/diheme cytochrome c family protein
MLRFLTSSALLFFSGLILIGCADGSKKEMTPEEMVSRGEYLVTFGGCNDCHTPKTFGPQGMDIDKSKLLSGHSQDAELPQFDTSMVKPGNWYLANSHLTAWVGPWGISYTANLTPDGPTGLGNWTSEIFIKAMRSGLHMGTGRQILPPMPWMMINKLTDEDLKSVFAYLQSIPAIRNQVPEPVAPNALASFRTAAAK